MNSYAEYFNLNVFEWGIFGLCLILIAGLLFLVPISLGIARRKYPQESAEALQGQSDSQDKPS